MSNPFDQARRLAKARSASRWKTEAMRPVFVLNHQEGSPRTVSASSPKNFSDHPPPLRTNMKRRSDSASAAVKALVDAASTPLQAPKHVPLRDSDLPFWRGVIASRTRDEWTEADLVLAARLARVQADLEAESKALDLEGSVIGDKINPRATVIDQLVKRELALMRSLRMTGRVAGDSRHEEGRRRTARQARKVRDDLKDDPLLA